MNKNKAVQTLKDNKKEFDTALSGIESDDISFKEIKAVAENKDKKFTKQSVAAAKYLLANKMLKDLDTKGSSYEYRNGGDQRLSDSEIEEWLKKDTFRTKVQKGEF